MKIIYHHRTRAQHAEGVHVREIIKAFREKGHEVFIVAPPGVDTFKCETQNPDQKKSNFWSLISRYMPQIIFEILEIIYNVVALCNLNKQIKQVKIDFIYERYAFFSFAGSCVAKYNKIPLILEVNEISGLKRTRGQVLKGLAGMLERNICLRADAIVVVSSFLKDKIVNIGIAPDKIIVIPNGVDVTRFNSAISRNKTIEMEYNLMNNIVLGFVGNFVKWHNFDLLIETFNDIAKERNLKLMLVGDGPARSEIQDSINKYVIQDKVLITGSIDHMRIPEFIQLMDICIIPHSNEFRSPIKMFEYMAMGKPVVAPKVGPIEQVIDDGVNGILFMPNDKYSFRSCLIDLINDRRKRDELGSNAKNDIMSHYLWKYNADKVLNIVSEIEGTKVLKG